MSESWGKINDRFNNSGNESRWRKLIWIIPIIILILILVIFVIFYKTGNSTPNYQKDFRTIAYLGGGSFGTVFEAKNVSDGKLYAVKKVLLQENEYPSKELREATILSSLKHNNIVGYYNHWREKDGKKIYLYIQMELCHSLEKWLQKSFDRDYSQVLNFKQQLIDGTEFIHSNNIIHRDLKPLNILLTHDYIIKICDFGLATMMTKRYNENCASEIREHTANVGTFLYVAPEVLSYRKYTENRKIYNEKVDIYSLGIVFFELTYFFTNMERIKVLMDLRKSIFPRNFAEIYPAAYNLIKMMLNENPTERPSAGLIKKMLM